jgi:transcriptional regulator with XRE-family HTH domain
MQDYQKLKLLRHLKQFSQPDIAFELGISQNTYSKIETGKRKLSDERKKQILNLFGISLDTFESINFSILNNNCKVAETIE